MLKFMRVIYISIIVCLVFVVVNISSEPLRKDNNSGKTLVQGALDQLLAKQTKSDREDEPHADRTGVKPAGLLHTSIHGGGGNGVGYFPGGPGYGPGGSQFGYGGAYGNNFAAGYYQGGGYPPPYPDYGHSHYCQSSHCQHCCHHCSCYPHKRGQGFEYNSDTNSPIVPYKVKEGVEVLERFSRANNDGSQEHK